MSGLASRMDVVAGRLDSTRRPEPGPTDGYRRARRSRSHRTAAHQVWSSCQRLHGVRSPLRSAPPGAADGSPTGSGGKSKDVNWDGRGTVSVRGLPTTTGRAQTPPEPTHGPTARLTESAAEAGDWVGWLVGAPCDEYIGVALQFDAGRRVARSRRDRGRVDRAAGVCSTGYRR